MTDNQSTPTRPEHSQPLPPDPPPVQSSGGATPQPPPQPTISPQVLAQILSAQMAQPRGIVMPGQPIMMGAPQGAPMMLAAQVVQQMQSWQGPYPPPDAVERYEKLLPGTFDRMIRMAEQLQSAQIEEAKEIRKMTHGDQQRGHYLGFATAVGAMIGGLACLKFNAPWLGAVFLSVPVMGVAKALIESTLRSQMQTSTTVTSQPIAPTSPPQAPPEPPPT